MKRNLPTSLGGQKAQPRASAAPIIDLTTFAFQPAAQPSSSTALPIVIDITDDREPVQLLRPAAARPQPRRLPASFGPHSSVDTRGSDRERLRPVKLTLAIASLTNFTATLSRIHAKAAQKLEALHGATRQPLVSGGGGDSGGGGASGGGEGDGGGGFTWTFGLAQYEAVLCELSTAAAGWHGLRFEQVPRAALAAATLGASAPSADSEATRRLLEAVPRALLELLAPYQREGVAFILRRGGRALLADEMGLGKTVQAIAAAAAYVGDWPLLVACPASARLHWRDELLRWLPTLLGPEDVCVLLKGRQALPRASVYVLSYDLVPRLRSELDNLRPQIIICDESQCLMSRAAQRTKAMLPLLKVR